MDDANFSKQKIENIPETLLDPIDNIVANLGITRSQFLRQQLRIIVNAYPDQMKNEFNENQPKKMVNLNNLSIDIKKQVEHISKNIGISQSAFIKMELQKILNTYPASMKQPPLDF